MPIINRFADLAEEITEWRRDIHAHPELLYDTHRTSELVADKLKAFGVDEVATGIGRTGVVGETADPELNPRIVGPRAEAEAAQALVGQARLRPNPEVSLEVEMT